MGYGSEAIIQRIGVKTNKGIISTPLGANMQVKYNLDSDQTLLRIFSEWADSHGHKVLMPFTANCSIDALRACDTYIALAADKKYLMGRIADCGEPSDANHPHTVCRTTIWQHRKRSGSRWTMWNMATSSISPTGGHPPPKAPRSTRWSRCSPTQRSR